MARFDESVEGPNTLAQAGQVESLGAMPLFVLASARPSIVAGEGENVQEVWLELQRELAQLGAKGEIQTLKESGHYIQFDRPQVVTEAIRSVAAQ